MRSPALLDASVLIALFDLAHVHHEVAHDWFADNRGRGWATSPLTENALLRIVSDLFVLVFALVFVWWGIGFVRFGWDQLSELAELPMPWIFAAWPLAGITWAIFLGESFVDSWRVLLGKTAQA